MEFPQEHHYREGDLLITNQDYSPLRFGGMDKRSPPFLRGYHKGFGQRRRRTNANVTNRKNDNRISPHHNVNHQDRLLHSRNYHFYYDGTDALDYEDDNRSNRNKSKYQHSSNNFRKQNGDWSGRHHHPSYYDEDCDRRDNMRYKKSFVKKNDNKYKLDGYESNASFERREASVRRLIKRKKRLEYALREVMGKRKKSESSSSSTDNDFVYRRKKRRRSYLSSSNSKRKDKLYDSDKLVSDFDKNRISSKYSDDEKQIKSKCKNGNDKKNVIDYCRTLNSDQEAEKVYQENPNSLNYVSENLKTEKTCFRNSHKIHSSPTKTSPTKDTVVSPADQKLISCKTTDKVFSNPTQIDKSQLKLASHDLPKSPDKNSTVPALIPVDNATEHNTVRSKNEVEKLLKKSLKKCSKNVKIVIEDIFKSNTNVMTTCIKKKYNLDDPDKYIIDAEENRISEKLELLENKSVFSRIRKSAMSSTSSDVFNEMSQSHGPKVILTEENIKDSNTNIVLSSDTEKLKLHESNKEAQFLSQFFFDIPDKNNFTSKIFYINICETDVNNSPSEKSNKVQQEHVPTVIPTEENIENNTAGTQILPSTNTEAQQIPHCPNLTLISEEECNKKKTEVNLQESNTEAQDVPLIFVDNTDKNNLTEENSINSDLNICKNSVSINPGKVINKVPQELVPQVIPTKENIENNTATTEILPLKSDKKSKSYQSIKDDFLIYVDAQLELSFTERLKNECLSKYARTSASQGQGGFSNRKERDSKVLPTSRVVVDSQHTTKVENNPSLKIYPQQKDEGFNNAMELSAEINELPDKSAESTTTEVNNGIIIDKVEVATIDNDSIENDVSLDTNSLINKTDVALNMDAVKMTKCEDILYLNDNDTIMLDCASVDVKTEADNEYYPDPDNIKNDCQSKRENDNNEDMIEDFLELPSTSVSALTPIETHQNEAKAEPTVGTATHRTADTDAEADEDTNEDFPHLTSDHVSALRSWIQRSAVGIKDKDIFSKCVNQLAAWPIVVIEKLSEKKIKMHNGRYPPRRQENWSAHPQSYPPPQRYRPDQPWHNKNYPPFYGPNVYQGNGDWRDSNYCDHNWTYQPTMLGNERNNMTWSQPAPWNINFHCSGFNRSRGRTRGRPKKYGSYSNERRSSEMNPNQSVTNNRRLRSRSRSPRRRDNSNNRNIHIISSCANDVKNKSEKHREKTSKEITEISLALKKGVEFDTVIQNEAISIQSSSTENSFCSVQVTSKHKNTKQRMDSVETVTFADESDSATVKTIRSKTSTYSESVKSSTSEVTNNLLSQTNKIEPKEEIDFLFIESVDSDSTYVSNHENNRPDKSKSKRNKSDEIICINSSYSDTEIDEKRTNNEKKTKQKKKKLTKKAIEVKDKQGLLRKSNQKSVQLVNNEMCKTNYTKVLALVDSTDSESDFTQIKQEIDVKTEKSVIEVENIMEVAQVKPTYTANEESESSMSADTVIREDRTYYKIVENGISDSDSQFDVRELSASPTELDKNERVQKWIEYQDSQRLEADGDMYNAKGSSRISKKLKILFDSDPLEREEVNKDKDILGNNRDSHIRKRSKILKNKETTLNVTEIMNKKRRLTEDLPYPTASENIEKNTKTSKISSNHNTGSVGKALAKGHCVTSEKLTISDNPTNPTNVIIDKNTKSDHDKEKVCSGTSNKSKNRKSLSSANSKEKVSSLKLSNRHSTNRSHQSKEHTSNCKSDSAQINKHESKKERCVKSSKVSKYSVKNNEHSNKDKSKDSVHKKKRDSVEQLPVPDTNTQILHIPTSNLYDSNENDKVDHVSSSPGHLNNTDLSENNLQSAIPLKSNEANGSKEAQTNNDLPDSLSVELIDLNIIDSIFPSALDNPNDETNNEVTLIVVPPTSVVAPIKEVSIAPSTNQEQLLIEREASPIVLPPSILEVPTVSILSKQQENKSNLSEALPMCTNNVFTTSISNTIAPLPPIVMKALQNRNAILNPIIPGRVRVRPLSTMISKHNDFINCEEISLMAQHIFILFQDYILCEAQIASTPSRKVELEQQYNDLNRVDTIRSKIINRIMNDIHKKYKTTFNPLNDTIIQNILYQKISDLNCKFPNQYTIDFHRKLIAVISLRYATFFGNCCTCVQCSLTKQIGLGKTPNNQNDVTSNPPASSYQSAQPVNFPKQPYTTLQPHNVVQISPQELRSTQQSTVPLNVAQQLSGLQQSRGVPQVCSTTVQQINYTHQGRQQSGVVQQIHYAQQHSSPHHVQSIQTRTSIYNQNPGLSQQHYQQFNPGHQYLPVSVNRTNFMQQTNLMQQPNFPQPSVGSESMGATSSNYIPSYGQEISRDLNRTIINNTSSSGSEIFRNVSQSLPNQLHNTGWVSHQVNNNTAQSILTSLPSQYPGFNPNTSASTSLNKEYSNPAGSAQQCCTLPPSSNANVAHTGYSNSLGYGYGSGSCMSQNRGPPPSYPYGSYPVFNAPFNWPQYPVYKDTSSIRPSLNATNNLNNLSNLNSQSNCVQATSASTGIQTSNRPAVTSSQSNINNTNPTQTILPSTLSSASSVICGNTRQNSTLNISQSSQNSTDHLPTLHSSHSSRGHIPTSSAVTIHYNESPTDLVNSPKHSWSFKNVTGKMIQKPTYRYNELAPKNNITKPISDKIRVKITPARFSTTVTTPSNVSSNSSENTRNEIHSAASSDSNLAVSTTEKIKNASVFSSVEKRTSKDAKIDAPFISPQSVVSDIPLPAKVRATTVYIPAISPDSAVSNLSFVSQFSPAINEAAPLDGQMNNMALTPGFGQEQRNTYFKNTVVGTSNLKKPNTVTNLPSPLADSLSKKLSSASSVNSSEANNKEENNKDRSPSVCSRDSGVIDEMINDEESNEHVLEVSRNVLCSMCEKVASMSCGQCRLSCYCSEKCQKAHWELNHSLSCSKPNTGRK